MKTLGYYNGKIRDLEHSTIPMLDRATYYGDGVFNVSYCRNRHIYELDAHLEGLYSSAQGVKIEPPVSREELKDLLYRLVKKLDDNELRIYVQFTRGTGIRQYSFTSTAEKTNLMIMITPGGIQDIHKTVRCITGEDRRHLICNFKTLNYIANVLEQQAVDAAGADDFIGHRGDMVTEFIHSNLAILKDGSLITPPANQYIYAGVGRKLMLEECKTLAIPFAERPISLEELFSADEVIRISGSSLCMQVVEIDGKPVGGKSQELLHTLQNSLLERFLKATN